MPTSETARPANLAAFADVAPTFAKNGSPLTGRLSAIMAERIDPASLVGRRVAEWPGDPVSDLLPLRLAAGLHALVRRGEEPALGAAYRTGEGLDDAVADVARRRDAWLAGWLDSPPQTNEVARATAIMAGLLAIASRATPKIELLELGASAGLNLLLDRFHIAMGGLSVGPAESRVRLAHRWDGPSPPDVGLHIVARRRVDLNPMDVHDPAVAERLAAFIWADNQDRLALSEAAIALAREQGPAPVDRGSAETWLGEHLSAPQPAGVTRVVFHSLFWIYLPVALRDAIRAVMADAALHATAERPLAWLSFEPDRSGNNIPLRLRLWNGQAPVDIVLADCHPQGRGVTWRG